MDALSRTRCSSCAAVFSALTGGGTRRDVHCLLVRCLHLVLLLLFLLFLLVLLFLLLLLLRLFRLLHLLLRVRRELTLRTNDRRVRSRSAIGVVYRSSS